VRSVHRRVRLGSRRGSAPQKSAGEACTVALNPYQQYRATKVETAGSVDLIVMLYQGAVRFIRVGLEALDRHDYQTVNTNFVKAQNIVVELRGSLNHEDGGDIARQLSSLYEYCYRQLVMANLKKDPAPAREVIGILRDLGTAWQQVASQQRQARAVNVGRPQMARAI
jgi:flagellar protein FliS